MKPLQMTLPVCAALGALMIGGTALAQAPKTYKIGRAHV